MVKYLSQDEILAAIDVAIKGVTTTSELGSTALLHPKKLARFIRKLISKTVVLPEARFFLMETEKVEIDSIGFLKPILRSAPSEGDELAESAYAQPTTAQEILEAVEFQAIVSLTDKMLRRNIEKAALENTIIDLIGERVGLDIELAGIYGDTAGSGGMYALYPYLADNDGWLKRSKRRCIEDTNKARTGDFNTIAAQTTHTLDHGSEIDSGMDTIAYGVPITPGTYEIDLDDTTLQAHDDGAGNIVQDAASGISGTIDYESGHVSLIGLTASTGYTVEYDALAFNEDASSGLLFPENMFEIMLAAVDKNYFTNPMDWRFYVPWDYENKYRNLLKSRGTELGDATQVGAPPLKYKDVPIRVVGAMANLQRSWLVPPVNVAYGVFHAIELERDRVIKKKRVDLVLNTEIDHGFEDPENSVVAEVVAAGP